MFIDGKTIYPIDFNDAMVHFLTIDIVNALNELSHIFHSDFLKGYQTVKALSKSYDQEYKLCELFGHLYKNTRIKRSLYEPVPNQPEWMLELRKKLKSAIKTLSL